ncbi:MAG: stage II sporulation protein P [Faecousia sp.]
MRESPAPWLCVPAKPVFSAEEADALEMDYDCSRRPDLATLLSQPLDWDLTGDAPAVLIFHTHTTESYTKAGEDYEETSRYRTLEPQYNMLSIGETVANLLEEAGIGVIHDRTVHDHPSYNGSYVHARQTVQEILTENPSIRLVLDLHRDASETAGKQLRTEALVAGEPSAQLMFVVGTDVSYPSHENWEENLSLALKLQALLSREHPGLVRPLNLRSQRFNQDLSPGALLVEVGAAGNTHGEALTAARALAEAVIQLSRGGETALQDVHISETIERETCNSVLLYR